MRASKKLLDTPLVKADYSYFDKFERLQDLEKLKLESSRSSSRYGSWKFLHETFLPDDYEISYRGISITKKTTRTASGYGGRPYATHAVKYSITVGPDGKYNPDYKKRLEVKSCDDFHNHADTYRGNQPFFNIELANDFQTLWVNYHLQWSAARSEAKAKLKKRIAEDPDFAHEQKVLGDIDRTKAIMAVMKPLQRLRSATDSVIAGIGKGSLSAATLREWSAAVGSIGKNRQPVLLPLKKYFTNKK